ncbi:MAG: NAD-dependent epimerase/dehydratase family protein [Myxococcota bacterium]
MSTRALVIGGTGPTGPFIVNGLRKRGFAVAMLHSGRHERDEIPADIEHLHANPFDERALEAALAGRSFDVCVATYGRLRATAAVMVGRCAKFISVGGGPAYLGYMNAGTWRPAGMPVPTREDAPLVAREADDAKGFRIARTEERVLALHPSATHFRYPYVYGPHQLVPREWCVVRRIRDRRPFIVLADGGLTLCSYGYAENLAHAVLLALDHPRAAAGQIYNCADEEVLSVRQVVEIARDSLGAALAIESLPVELAAPARPLLMQPWSTHRVLDLAKLRGELGYRDVLPAREALARTARWLNDHPLEPGGVEEKILQDPFDYAAEDALVAGWRRALASIPAVEWKRAPGYTASYSGPGGTPRTGKFE